MKVRALIAMLAAFLPAAFSQPADGVVVPEPSTVALMAIGLTGLGIAAWRRNRRK